MTPCLQPFISINMSCLDDNSHLLPSLTHLSPEIESSAGLLALSQSHCSSLTSDDVWRTKLGQAGHILVPIHIHKCMNLCYAHYLQHNFPTHTPYASSPLSSQQQPHSLLPSHSLLPESDLLWRERESRARCQRILSEVQTLIYLRFKSWETTTIHYTLY
jgi:hypothetical protein